MTSSQRMTKRLSILGVVTLFFSVVFGVWYFFLIPDPTCFDGKQNQKERGTDCGGPCGLACEEEYAPEPLVIRETAFVPGGDPGEYDVLVKLYNPNDALGASSLPYIFQLQDASGVVLAETSGEGFILPQETKTFLAIGLRSAILPQTIAVSFPETKWEKFSGYQERPLISIVNKRYNPDSSGPFFSEVTGSIVNESQYDFRTVVVKVVLRDASGMPVAFNQTQMGAVRTKEHRDFRLPWPKAFPGEVVQMDVESDIDIYHEENFIRQYVAPERFQELR